MPLFGTFSNERTGLQLPSMSNKEMPPSVYDDIKSGEELTLVFKLGDPITNKSVGITPSSQLKINTKINYKLYNQVIKSLPSCSIFFRHIEREQSHILIVRSADAEHKI